LNEIPKSLLIIQILEATKPTNNNDHGNGYNYNKEASSNPTNYNPAYDFEKTPSSNYSQPQVSSNNSGFSGGSRQ
jgi:hypothetical protein